MERYTPLHTLHSRVTDEIICVRVSRLWYNRGGADRGPVKDIHMVVVDMQGDAFHAFVPHGFFGQLIGTLHERNVYELSRFLLVKKQEVMRPVDMPRAILITHSTVVQRKDNLADILPEWSYSLTPSSCLPAPTVEPGCLVDVIGIISGISDIESFDIPNKSVLIKRHVLLRDLSGHEIKIVLWGGCALRFNGNVIRALGQTESAVAIFVGTTVQEYDGERGLAGMAECSWYINEDIVDINIFRASLEGAFQPIAHAPLPHLLSRRTQVGVDWPKKQVIQLATFNLFENKAATFRCTVTLSRIDSKKQWWYTGCQACHRLARPTISSYADPRTYTCTDPRCPSTTANIVYNLSVIGLDRTDEAEFVLFGALAEQVTRNSIHRVIRNNQLAGPPIANDGIAASRVRFPPPEVSRILGNRYRFVVEVTEGSFSKRQTSFMVRKVEAAFPRERRLSSVDTVIPATSWDVVNPTVIPGPSAKDSSAVETVPSNQGNRIPTGPVVVIPANSQTMNTPGSSITGSVLGGVNNMQRAPGSQSMFTPRATNINTGAGSSTQVLPGSSSLPRLTSTATAFNRKKRKWVLDVRRGLNSGAPYQ